MILPALAAFYLVCAAQPGEVVLQDPFAGAVEVLRYSFEREEDLDFDDRPDDWTRRRGRGFPAYVEGAIDRTHGAHGEQSLRFTANGAQAAYYSPAVRIDALHCYVCQARLRTEALHYDAARISVSFLNHKRQRVQRFLARPISGTHGDWVQVRLGPLIPHPDARFVVFGCHLVQNDRADVRGRAWFDDLWLGRLPRLTLVSNYQTHFVQRSAPVRIEARVSGLDEGREYGLGLQLIDNRNAVVAETSFPLEPDEGSITETGDETPQEPQSKIWEVPALEYGFYRARAVLKRDGAAMFESQTTFAVMELVEGDRGGEFGWTVERPISGMSPEALTELAAQSGINWIKYPLWSSESGGRSDSAQVAELFELLGRRRIQAVGLLSDPPDDIRSKFAPQWTGISEIFAMPVSFWSPSLDPVMARYASNVRYWQLGADSDRSFVGMSNLPALLSDIKREFDRIGRDTRIGLPWDWESPLPQHSRLPKTFFSFASSERLAPGQLQQKLQDASALGVPRWTVLKPLPRPDVSADQQGADLVKRMVAARIGGADAIFVSDIFDEATGLINADGSPAPLLLPWRTAALALRGAEFLGSFDLPRGSRNYVFARSGEAIVVLWNDESTVEPTYLGEPANVVLTDIWGVKTRPVAEAESRMQQIPTGPMPLIARGCSEPIARWRLDVRFEKGRVDSATGRHQEAIIGRNPFPQGVSGTVSLQMPGDWDIEPRSWTLQLAAGEPFRLPLQLTLPPNTPLGEQPATIEFEVDADRKYRFRVERSLIIGLGDITIDVRDHRRPDGALEVEQILTNQTSPEEVLNFECELFVPGQKRLKTTLTKVGRGTGTKIYVLPDADALKGQELWLRLEQIGGRRVLNYRWSVGKDWDKQR